MGVQSASRPLRLLAAILTVIVLVAPGAETGGAQREVEVLSPVFALPAHVINRFEQPVSFAATRDGHYLVLDRRAHTVYRITPDGQAGAPMLHIGQEPGRVLRPASMALGDDDILAVLDTPATHQRIQYFTPEGHLVGGFLLPGGSQHSLMVNDQAVSGAGAMTFRGGSIWLSAPGWGALMSELDTTGAVARHVGQLRETGFEATPSLHQALNAGFPVVDPAGGLFFVFQSGVPLLRRYDAAGQLVFERHIEGIELDAIIQQLPDTWTERGDGSRPLPAPVVRTAEMDDEGQLWVVLQTGHIYIYDRAGEKRRVVVFGGATPQLTSSLFFTSRGRVLVGPGGYEFESSPPAR